MIYNFFTMSSLALFLLASYATKACHYEEINPLLSNRESTSSQSRGSKPFSDEESTRKSDSRTYVQDSYPIEPYMEKLYFFCIQQKKSFSLNKAKALLVPLINNYPAFIRTIIRAYCMPETMAEAIYQDFKDTHPQSK